MTLEHTRRQEPQAGDEILFFDDQVQDHETGHIISVNGNHILAVLDTTSLIESFDTRRFQAIAHGRFEEVTWGSKLDDTEIRD